MAEVAELAFRAWRDRAFTDQVHASLNEAMTNVIMHAYPEDITDQSSCLPGQWWVAGIVNRQANKAFFFALDHGVGIPRTAIQNYDGLLEKFEFDPAEPHDHLILGAVVKEARTQTGLSQHGKGLMSMIRLIDEKAIGGSILIASQQGEHTIVKDMTQNHPLRRRVEYGRLLPDRIPGTLIVWQLDGPINQLAAERIAS